MSVHVFTVSVEVDDEKLKAHPGEHEPPPNNPASWEFSDLVIATQKGIVDHVNTTIIDYEKHS